MILFQVNVCVNKDKTSQRGHFFSFLRIVFLLDSFKPTCHFVSFKILMNVRKDQVKRGVLKTCKKLTYNRTQLFHKESALKDFAKISERFF